jgi:NADH-quinone oxidoreductase subunit G
VNALRVLGGAEFVVAITPFASEEVMRVAHVLLPIGSFAETSGTFVNLEGQWQSWAGAAKLLGEARPGWKVLRVLGNLLDLPGFDYNSSDDVLKQLRALCDAVPTKPAAGSYTVAAKFVMPDAELASAGRYRPGMYQIDALLRRAPALQLTHDGQTRV